MTVVNEPITIMANPTYLPARIADKYDELWTEERMTQLIDAAVKNNVAFEIQAGSAFPSDKFIERAKAKGAKFTIGRNNHFDQMIDLTHCFDKLRKHKLVEKNLLLLPPKAP
jgi:histidinol phosphatase-like PHP family hydrolase